MARLRWVAVAALCAAGLVVAGCGGGGGDDAPAAATTAASTALADGDAALIDEMTTGLDSIASISSEGPACGADLECLTDVQQRLAAVATEGLPGLRAKADAASSPCVRDAGQWYALTLERYQLAHEFLVSGDIDGSTDQINKASDNIENATSALVGCAP